MALKSRHIDSYDICNLAICPIGPLLIRPTLNFPLEVLSLMNFMVILEEERVSKVLNIKSNQNIVLIVWKPVVVNTVLELKHVKDLIGTE